VSIVKQTGRFIDAQGKAVGGEYSDGDHTLPLASNPVFVAVNKA
jgi:hypothetical protein